MSLATWCLEASLYSGSRWKSGRLGKRRGGSEGPLWLGSRLGPRLVAINDQLGRLQEQRQSELRPEQLQRLLMEAAASQSAVDAASKVQSLTQVGGAWVLLLWLGRAGEPHVRRAGAW